MFAIWVLIPTLFLAFHAPHKQETCLVRGSPASPQRACRTQVAQSRHGQHRQVTSLTLACRDIPDGTARTIFVVSGNDGLALTWKDENNLMVQYKAGAKIEQAITQVALENRVVTVEYVATDASFPGCDYGEDNILNVASAS